MLSVPYLLSLWRKRWRPSEFSHFPAAGAADPEHAGYLLLARRLARLRARCTPRGAQRDFAATLQARRAINAGAGFA